ncbi:MAG: hypothetical protein OEM25_01700 [Gammaproteobacteria bacterium]|nr:hypothetical protein [Gammaproteobacteria bacterium]
MMLRNLPLLGLILFTTSAFGDANDGEYLGFKLGEKFAAPPEAVGVEHIMGALIYVVDPGDHQHHIDAISIYVSPKSSVVGSVFGEWYFSNPRAAKVFAKRYMESLAAKYPHWKHRGSSLSYGDYQLWVDVEEKPPIVDYWPSPLNIRVAIGLIFSPDSSGRIEWMTLIRSELGQVEFASSN